MAFVSVKTGKKVQLGTGYTSNPIDYQTWKRQQEAKLAAAKPSASSPSPAASSSKGAGTSAADSAQKARRTAAGGANTNPVTLWQKPRAKAQAAANGETAKPASSFTAPSAGKAAGPATGAANRAGAVWQIENQRRQAAADLDTETLRQLNLLAKDLRAAQGKQTFGDRASDVLSAILSGSGSSLTNLLGMGSSSAQDEAYNQRQIARLQKSLETGRTTDGKPISDAQRQTIQAGIDRLRRGENPYYQAADRMQDDSARFQQSAKAGLGGVGSTVVDAATSMGQSLLDNAVGAVTGTGMLPFAARAFGGAAQEARRGGGDMKDQLLYGSAQAAKEYVTEKLFGLAAPQRLIGGGSFDDAVEKGIRNVTERLAKTPAGQKVLGGVLTWLGGGATEALEEGIGSVIENTLINPNLRDWDPDTRTGQQKFEDGLYDMLVGGVSGLMGVTNAFSYNVSPQVRAQYAANRTETAPGARPAASGGTDTSVTENAARAPQKSPESVILDAAAEGEEQGKRVVRDALELMQRAAGMETGGTQQKTASETGTVVNETKERNQGETVRIINRLKSSIPQLSQTAPVAMASVNSVKTVPGTTMAEKGRTLFNAIKGIVTRPGFGDVEINNRSVKDDLSHGIGPAKAAVITAVPEIIRSGTQIDFQENWKGRPYDGYVFAAPVILDGSPVYVAAIVKRTSKNRLYLHEVVDSTGNIIKIDNEAQANQTSLAGEPGAGAQTSLPVEGQGPLNINSTIPQGTENVNPSGGDGLGAADVGFTTRGMEGQERTSRMAQSHPYNQYQEAATAMTREEYDRLFRYQSQTEAKTTHLAEELVYVLQNGKKTFLKDVNEDAYNALTESLREAAAWTPEQFDAAHMILNELNGKSAGAEIESEEYTDWFKEVRQHETVGGQAVQAISKWTRDNRTGLASERDALDNLEKSGLSQEEQRRIYGRIIQLDNKINAVQEGDTASLKSIILETAADRGLIRGKRGELLSLWASRALDAMNFEQMKQFAFSSTSALSSDTVKADWGQMVRTCQVLSMLSNKATVSRNLLGNTSFYGVDALAMDGAALLDMAVSKATGTRSVAMERFALADALRAAWISQAEVLLDVDMGGEKTRYGTGSNRTFKAGSKHAAARFLSALERNQALYLTVPDEFFKGLARGNAAATQKLIDQGKIKTDNANYAAEQADALAKYRTFQDDTKIAAAIQEVHDACNILLGFGDSGRTSHGHKVHAFGFGDFVAAFTKVAGNLATRGIEYSPHNAVKGTLELVHQIYNAKTGKTVDTAKQAKGVSNVARGLTGAVIANVFRGLIRAGILRMADDDDDKNVAALNRSEGLDGVQLNLSAAYRWLRGEKNTEPQSGDTLIDASSLEPINQLMYAAAYLEDGMSPVSAYPSAALSAAADLPVLDTVGSVGKRVYKYGENIVDVAAEELGKTAVSSVLPNALRAVARGTDDRSRNSTVDFEDVEEQDPVKRFFRIMTEAAGKQAMAGTPGLREKLPGGVSPTGQDRTYPTSQLWNLINAVINPMGVNTYTQTEQSREWQRLREETGRTDFYPSSTIPKTVEGNKLSKELSYEQRQDFQRDRGVWLMLTVSEMMANRGYQSSGTQRQSDLMADARQFANEAAKRAVLGPEGVDKWVNGAMEAQKETGLSPASVIYYKDMLSREAEKEGVSSRDAKQTVRNAIYNDSSLTTPQKNALDDMIISDVIVIPQEKNVDYSNEDSFVVSQMSDSAVKHWPLVQEKMPDVNGEQYQTAWKIANTSGTKKDPYTEAEKKRDIQEETDLSTQEVNRLLRLIKTVIDDE